jgi:hypothetical protein
MFTRGTSPSAPLRASSRGQALVIVLVVITALLAAGIFFVRIVISERNMEELYSQKEKAFYLAEAGLEDGKSVIAANPNWFTDNPHMPADDTAWLIDGARGAIKQFGGAMPDGRQGSYKIIKESGKNIIYSVGHFAGGRSVLRIKYNFNPFKAFEFKII